MPTPTRPIPKLTPEQLERFRAKIDLNGPTQPHMDSPCHVWIGDRFTTGYGRARVNGGVYGAHRVAFAEAGGILTHLKNQVLHQCDNPSCVRPDHLFSGDAKDNAVDKARKGRCNPAVGDRNGSRTKPERFPKGDRHPSRLNPERMPRGDRHWSRIKKELVSRGENHGSTKLTDAQCAHIRSSLFSGAILARELGVSQALISLIRRGLHRQPPTTA